MKLALEAPTKLLGVAQPLSNIDYISADRFANDKEYAEIYLRSENKMKFLLMIDFNKDKLSKLTEEIKPNAVAVPEKYYAEVANIIGNKFTMPILNSTTLYNMFLSLSIYEGSPLAISHDILSAEGDDLFVSALRRALAVSKIPSSFYIHLLGFADLDEFAWYEGQPNVSSISTGAPVLLGLQGRSLADYVPDKGSPAIDQMEDILRKGQISDNHLSAIYSNIALLRKYMP